MNVPIIQIIKRYCFLVIAGYLFCVLTDPFFFDYPFSVLILRQIYGVLLAAGFLAFCVLTRYFGVLIYTLAAILFCGLHYAYRDFGYSVGFELINAICGTNVGELVGFLSFSLVWSILILFSVSPVIYLLAVRSIGWKKMNLRRMLVMMLLLCCWGLVYMIPDWSIGKRYGFYRKMADCTLRHDHEMFITGHMHLAVERWKSPFSNVAKLYGGICHYSADVTFVEAADFPSFDKRAGEDLVFIMVLGESVRADHVPAGGYTRNTMPRVGAEPGAFFFTRMYSYASNTYDSVAAILSGLIRETSSPTPASFASILKKHGFEGRLYSENTMNITDSKRFHMLLGQYMDSCESCRMPIKEVSSRIVRDIRACNNERQLVVIENGTGHFPYINEDVYDAYRPCNMDWMSPLPDNKQEILTNDYDNCIVSVDAFLADIINGVRDCNAVMLYVSDHGQLLFEGGKLMHGDPGNLLLRQPAAFVWFSPEYEQRHPEIVAAMKSVKDKPIVHGQVYSTVLKLCGIESEVPLQIGNFVDDDVRQHDHNVPPALIEQAADQENK